MQDPPGLFLALKPSPSLSLRTRYPVRACPELQINGMRSAMFGLPSRPLTHPPGLPVAGAATTPTLPSADLESALRGELDSGMSEPRPLAEQSRPAGLPAYSCTTSVIASPLSSSVPLSVAAFAVTSECVLAQRPSVASKARNTYLASTGSLTSSLNRRSALPSHPHLHSLLGSWPLEVFTDFQKNQVHSQNLAPLCSGGSCSCLPGEL